MRKRLRASSCFVPAFRVVAAPDGLVEEELLVAGPKRYPLELLLLLLRGSWAAVGACDGFGLGCRMTSGSGEGLISERVAACLVFFHGAINVGVQAFIAGFKIATGFFKSPFFIVITVGDRTTKS